MTTPTSDHQPALSGNVKTSILVVVGLLCAFAVGAALWYFGIRPKATPQPTTNTSNTNSAQANVNTTVMLPPPAPQQAADSDRDGLLDDEEAQAGTKIDSADSDDDGLSDRAELKVYSTNPLISDTDADGIRDGEEVRAGENPNGAGTLLDVEKAIEALNNSGT